jgi:2'-5' RNA ligase
MYGVIALFDEKTEQIIKDIWKELSEKSISFYAEEVEDRRPHITIASYNNLNKSEFIRLMDKFYDDKTNVDITFSSIGSFLSSGTLFFLPTVTTELIEFHFNHHEYFKKSSMIIPIRCICLANGYLIALLQIGYLMRN